MKYKVIGLMSGSSLDGLDIVYANLFEIAGNWSYEILNYDCIEYDLNWKNKLKNATKLFAEDYVILNADFGKYLGSCVNNFIKKNNLEFKVDFVASHGHTTFHLPENNVSEQIGCGANLSSQINLPVINNFRILDVANFGQGAPIVPICEKLFFKDYNFFLNIGGIANISYNNNEKNIAFDVCPTNSIINYFAKFKGLDYDNKGFIAQKGKINFNVINTLNQILYFNKNYPKSLSNEFAIKNIIPILNNKFNINEIENILATYYEFISIQIVKSIENIINIENDINFNKTLFITGGGAFNDFLIDKIKNKLNNINFEINIPNNIIINYKEALAMCLMGVLRWREEENVLNSVTGAKKNSVNGCIWYSEN